MNRIAIWLRTNALTGLFVTLPVVLSLYIFWVIITKLDAMLVPIIPTAYRPETWLGINIPGTGVIAGVVLMVVIGMMARNFFGRHIVRLGERIMSALPGISWIYSTIKQITETIAASQKDTFREAVMVEYPRKGMWCMAFVTGSTKGEIQDLTKDDMVNIFLPTTPNPTSGFLLFVPKKDVVLLKMSVEQATKTIISAGIITPPHITEIEEKSK